MKKIFDGKIYELLPKSDGILFPYQKAVIDEGDVVWYKMFSLENATMADVSEAIYRNIKFGSNYTAAVELCKNFVSEKAIMLPNGRLFLVNNNGQVFIIDPDGMINIGGEIKYRDQTPSDIAYYKNSIWACFKDSNVLIRFNINTLRVELRIGGKATPFNTPENIFIEGEWAYVCNSGSNKIIRVNLDNYTVEDHYVFEEPVHNYVKSEKCEFALLDSGLYII